MSAASYCAVLFRYTIVLYSTKNEKICLQEGTDKEQRIQTLRPLYLYPLWILEGVGQFRSPVRIGIRNASKKKRSQIYGNKYWLFEKKTIYNL